MTSESVGEDEVEESNLQPESYIFDPAHVTNAVAILDAACTDLENGYRPATQVMELARSAGLDESPLMWELIHVVGHDLQREVGGRGGCSLGRDVDEGLLRWPRPIAKAPPDALLLWEEAARAVTSPPAIARLEDLLFERRVGNGLERVRRATAAYLDAIDRADMFGLDETDALLRSWTLARSVKDAALEAHTRQRMVEVVSGALDEEPGASPGIVLPLLSALALGPLIDPDPHDIDGLLSRAAFAYRRHDLADGIATDRRRRAGGDPGLLEQIARDQVAAYFADADAAPNAAVRMHRLNAAARVATDLGLGDLAREAAARMQRIRPSELGMQRIRAESTIPMFVSESYIACFTRGSGWREGLAFFFRSDVPSGSLDQVRNIGSKSRGTLASLFPTTLMGRDGLPRLTVADDDAHGMSQAASMTATFYGRMFALGLDHLVERYGAPPEDELIDAIIDAGCRDPELARGLARAFEHFFSGDFESCVAVALPKFEAAARSLLRELDEGIYRVQVGADPGGYVGLYVLLEELEKLALDESWAYYFRWLLLGPYGANLRNDVAHGFVFDPGPAYAALVLRAVSVLVLACDTLPSDSYLPPIGTDRVAVRPRETVLKSLADPVAAQRMDRMVGRFADLLERTAWRLRARLVKSRSLRQSDGEDQDEANLAGAGVKPHAGPLHGRHGNAR